MDTQSDEWLEEVASRSSTVTEGRRRVFEHGVALALAAVESLPGDHSEVADSIRALLRRRPHSAP